MSFMGFPGASAVKKLLANSGDANSVPGSGRSLEKEMATHSSILAWKISWTEEPGRLQLTGPQRVRHNLATEHKHTPFNPVQQATG